MMNIINTLQSWLNDANLSQADLARRTKKTTGAISLIFSGQRNPSAELLVDIAKACNKTPEDALRLAGLLPPIQPETTQLKELAYLAAQLPDTELNDLIRYARLRLTIAEERGNYETEPHK